MDKRPIGIFDSGLGGLSAVKAALKYMPEENIIYFGDTKRVPYGTRSAETIEAFAKDDIAFLEKFDCKLIMAACGTVSTVAVHATSQLKDRFVGVVKPSCMAAVKASRNGRIGVMATAASINSGAYTREIRKINPEASVSGVACPVLVTLVENNHIDSDDMLSREIIKRYCVPLMEDKVDTIILGCTHFPHLAPIIQDIVGKDITLIDSGYEAIMEAKRILAEKDMLNIGGKGEKRYFVSDKVQNFSETAKTLLGKDISDRVEYRDITD